DARFAGSSGRGWRDDSRPAGGTSPKPRDGSIKSVSLPRLIEVAQIRRLLAFASGHQIAVGAQKIILLADGDVVVGFIAIILVPDRIFLAAIALHHCPRPR